MKCYLSRSFFCTGKLVNAIHKSPSELVRLPQRYLFHYDPEVISGRIDQAFQSSKTAYDQLPREMEERLSISYMEFLKILTHGGGGEKRSLETVEPLFMKRVAHLLKEIRKEKIRIELKFLNSESANKSPVNLIKLSKIGQLKIFGVSINREQNEFIHRYKYKKVNDELVFELIQKASEVKAPILPESNKKEEAKEELLELVKPDRRGFLRRTFQEIGNKLGYKYGEKDAELFGAPDIKGGWRKVNTSLFSTISKFENMILQEDFLVRSEVGLQIMTLDGKLIKEETPSKESGYFEHFARFETYLEKKEAPSVQVSKMKSLCDVDAWVKGNPVCLVKRFDI